MVLSDAMKLAVLDRIGHRAQGNMDEIAFTYWSGTMPTLVEFNAAFETSDLWIPSDGKPGRISTKALYDWLVSRGGVELTTIYHGATNFYEVLDKNNIIFDASSNVKDFTHEADGTIGMFTIMVLDDGATTANWHTSNFSALHVLLGSVGLVGSGADLEISDLDITSSKTVKLGTVNIKF